MRSLVLFLLCACGSVQPPIPACFGSSGMMYIGPDTEYWNCETFKRADEKIVKGFAASDTVDYRLKNMRFSGWSLVVIPTESWIAQGFGSVHGMTFCSQNFVQISSREFGRSSITHEYAHVGQRCSPIGPIKDHDGHDNWGRDGVVKAIIDINKDIE